MQEHPFINADVREELVKNGKLRLMKERKKRAWQWITIHPFQFFQLTLKRIRLFWLPDASLWADGTRAVWFKFLINWILCISGLLGCVLVLYKRNPHAIS